MKIRSLLACFLILGFVASIIAVPALGMGRAPSKVSKATAEEPPQIPEGSRFPGGGNPPTRGHFSNMPNPDPQNIEGDNGSVISSGNEDNIWVYPTGDESKDADNVQYAVDNVRNPGGNVRLMHGERLNPHGKAVKPNSYIAFNFGSSFVEITRSVNIIGHVPSGVLAKDWDPNAAYNRDFQIPGGTLKSDRTVIFSGCGGGAFPGWYGGAFFVRSDSAVTFRGLRGEKFENAFIRIWKGNGVSIYDNVMTNVVLKSFPHPAGTYWTGFGIMAGADPPTIPYYGIAGNHSITNNYIDCFPNGVVPPGNLIETANVYYLLFESGPYIDISENTFKNGGLYGVRVAGCPQAKADIKNNTIDQHAITTWGWGQGIAATSYVNRDKAPKELNIENNEMLNIGMTGMYLGRLQSDSTITGNSISFGPFSVDPQTGWGSNSAGIHLWGWDGLPYKAQVVGNRMEGEADQAFFCWTPTGTWGLSDSYIRVNLGDLAQFTPMFDWDPGPIEETYHFALYRTRNNTIEIPRIEGLRVRDAWGSNNTIIEY